MTDEFYHQRFGRTEGLSSRKDQDLKILILIQEGNLAEIEMWLSLGQSTEVTGQDRMTPIMFASQVMLSFNKCSDRHFI